jgi:hypothetical protein
MELTWYITSHNARCGAPRCVHPKTKCPNRSKRYYYMLHILLLLLTYVGAKEWYSAPWHLTVTAVVSTTISQWSQYHISNRVVQIVQILKTYNYVTQENSISKLMLESKTLLQKVIVAQLVKNFPHSSKVHYSVNKSPALLRIPSQMNPSNIVAPLWLRVLSSNPDKNSEMELNWIFGYQSCLYTEEGT